MRLNLEGKVFKPLSNSSNGEVSESTTFEYHQSGEIIFAYYSGGGILQGHLLGRMFADGHLEFSYHHLNDALEIMTGNCTTYPEVGSDGRIILHEKWQWTCRDFSKGESVLIEVRP
jgi:hypothetical protein